MFGIDLTRPDSDDIARARKLLELVGYRTRTMTDDEAMDAVRGLLLKTEQPPDQPSP